jgi:hypothetical protein
MQLRFLGIAVITVSLTAYWMDNALAQQPRCQSCVAVLTQFSEPQNWSITVTGSSQTTCRNNCSVQVTCALSALYPIGRDASPTVCGCVYDRSDATVPCRSVQCNAGQTVKATCSGVLSGTYTQKSDLTCTRLDGTVEPPP